VVLSFEENMIFGATSNGMISIPTFIERHMRRHTHKDILIRKIQNQAHYTLWRRLGGEEVYLLLILDLGTRLGGRGGVSGQGHAVAAIYTRGKDPRYPLDRRLGGSQSWSGHRG
jgi:hypothetical protein